MLISNAYSSHVLPAPKSGANLPPKIMNMIDKSAKDFESIFMSEMYKFMWTDVETDENFGGGHGEDMWRGMMIEEYGKQAGASGIGIAAAVRDELIRAQERAYHPTPVTEDTP